MASTELTIYKQTTNASNHCYLYVHGALTLPALAPYYWCWLEKQVSDSKVQFVTIDLQALTSLDDAGVILLANLYHFVASKGKLELKHVPLASRDRLGDLASVQLPNTQFVKQPNKWSFVARLGYSVDNWLANIYYDISFLGKFIASIGDWLRRPFLMRRQDFVHVLHTVGPGALPIIILLGFLMGLILSFQSAVPLQRFGAVTYVPNLVGLSLTRELGPLMVAIILAGRTASAFAAEIGTMKVNQELDALRTMGISTYVHLVLPRFIAVMLMAPFLTIFMIGIALVGSALFMCAEGYPLSVFKEQLQFAVQFKDLLGGLFKVTVFGMVIALLGCKHGLQTGSGARAVGQATTRAVVSSIVWFLILDGLFALVFYVLGL